MHNLDNVISMDSLYKSWQKISQKNTAPGLDGIDLSFYRTELQKNLRTLQTSVSTGNYRPYREKEYISKNRIISVSSLEDKIIQTALSEAIISNYQPVKSVHGFIKNKSIFTAKKSLDKAITEGLSEYIKVDIKRFYDNIDASLMYEKLKSIFDDTNLLDLFWLIINTHRPGLSTGSCLSPALSNLYLNEFDDHVENNTLFYSRYVDDMLVAPTTSLPIIEAKLSEVDLVINKDKTIEVEAGEGFRYLGFDIKHDIESAIYNNNFSLAEELYEIGESDIKHSEQQITETSRVETQKSDYEIPNTIRNVIKKCHVVGSIVKKAKEHHYVPFAEKMHLLQIFHCLGEDGANFIHYVLSYCKDYDYAETQRRINKYSAYSPLGCKKLRERIGNDTGCICNFSKEKLYPTPIIHAMRVDAKCYKPLEPKDNLGHFKSKNPTDKVTDALNSMLELNKKQYEIGQQQEILKGQIEDLFQRNNSLEIQTPQGLIIKTDDGIFLKVG